MCILIKNTLQNKYLKNASQVSSTYSYNLSCQHGVFGINFSGFQKKKLGFDKSKTTKVGKEDISPTELDELIESIQQMDHMKISTQVHPGEYINFDIYK